MYRAVWCGLTEERCKRRGHPHPAGVDDADRFEVRGPHGTRFALRTDVSDPHDYAFYLLDADGTWVDLGTELDAALVRLECAAAPPLARTVLESLRSAAHLLEVHAAAARELDPWHRAVALAVLESVEATAARARDFERARSRVDDADSDADFADAESSTSDSTSGSAIDSAEVADLG